ncbi:MAG: prolipoprotein diacylglyceryl transferase [Clostridia bacterium]|nr:prolipoprotein diacylglyceryl transferase [Clostridia bacterium]
MLKISNLSFPGLGIGEFSINSVAFTLFGKEVAWYGLIITVGMILAVLYVGWRAKQNNIRFDDILDIALLTIPVGVLGARLYYVLTTLERNYSFWDVFKIWEGGLAIYGGIIGGALAVILMSRIKKISFFLLADMISPAVLLAQAIGRWGNFCNAEAYGYETTLPWRMGLELGGEWIYVHPTFLYESLWNIVGVVLINLFYGFVKEKSHKQYDGQIFLMIFTWYGFGRMFIEGLRTDSLYIFQSWLGETVRISQVLGGAIFLVGAFLLIYHWITKTDMLFKPLKAEKSESAEK